MDQQEPVHVLPGSEDAGLYFKHMSDFVGFTEADAEAIRQSALIIEKHLPAIIGSFYTNLLQYPPTRKFFLKKDGTVDQAYVQLRMFHQANFWRRTAGGVYNDDYAHFVDYVGRAHTSRGADPKLYIAERYVIGMVGFVQHAIIDALMKELHGFDDDLEARAVKAWNKICMVILEMLARAYVDENSAEAYASFIQVDSNSVHQMSVDSYERSLELYRPDQYQEISVGPAADIPDGERKIVQIGNISVGIFHHKGSWYALRNHCLHRGGPVATGLLKDDTLICPWHGYSYNLTNGRLLIDPGARLEMFKVSIHDGELHLHIPGEVLSAIALEPQKDLALGNLEKPKGKLGENEFLASELKPGQARLVHLNGLPVAVYNVEGTFYATQEACTHEGGPLSEGDLSGKIITCPWHFSCFDVTNGQVVCDPATEPLDTFQVILDGDIARVVPKK